MLMEPAGGWVQRALEAGKSVVTANKKLIAYRGVELEQLAAAKGGHLKYGAAVAGGVPVIPAIEQGLAGDRIETIFGKAFRQTPLADIFPKSEFQGVFERAKRVVSEPAVCRGEGLVFKQLNKFGYGERIMLPLASDGVCADGILGCTEYQSIDGPYDGSLPQIDEWFPL